VTDTQQSKPALFLTVNIAAAVAAVGIVVYAFVKQSAPDTTSLITRMFYWHAILLVIWSVLNTLVLMGLQRKNAPAPIGNYEFSMMMGFLMPLGFTLVLYFSLMFLHPGG
jgi:hypothetical protein